MGNQQNSSNTDRKREKKDLLIDTKNNNNNSNFQISNPDTNSSYRGVKTSANCSANDLDKDGKAEQTTDCQTIPDKIDLRNIKIPTAFEWKEGGNVVYITGSFSNWSQWFIMTKINNKFELNLDLPSGIHQYKFIVDNAWRFSKHHPTCNDGKGNTNNIIDTTNVNIDDLIQRKIDKLKGDQNSFNSKLNNNYNGKRIRKSESSYNNTFPSKDDLNMDAVFIPENYKEIYNINTYHKQLLLGNREFLAKKENKNYIGGNSSFISVPVPPHINLNHLSMKADNSLQLKNEILVTSSVQRIRNKYVTLIYYKPID